VKKGETLATISAPDLDQQLEEAKGQLVQLQAAVEQAQANAELGKVKAQISRELDRLEITLAQLKVVEAERDALLESASQGTPTPAATLLRLKWIGAEFATVLWSEGLFRSFANRRQVAAYAGLAPTPWKSGSIDHEQRGVQGR
jgi:transposase